MRRQNATRPPWRALALVFAAALTARIVYLFQIESLPFFYTPVGDAASYLSWAKQIAGGDIWGHEAFYQAPLYPYFLAAIRSVLNPTLFDLRVVQAVMGACACVLVLIAATRFVSPRVGVAAGLLLAFYPPAIFFDGLIQKTSLALLLLGALMVVLGGLSNRPCLRRFCAAGVILGLLGITRENALALTAVVLASVWLRRGVHLSYRAKQSAMFIAGIAIILLPVAVRNLAVAGEFSLTTVQMGPNFFIGNHPGATGRYIALQPGHESPPFERQDAKRLAERAVGRPLTDGQVSRYWLDRSVRYISQQPWNWMTLMATKWMLVWNAYEIPDTQAYSIYVDQSSLLRTLDRVWHFGVLCPMAAAGVVLGWRHRSRLVLVYAMLLVLAASVAAFYVFGRYRFPLVPLLMIPAGVAIVEVGRWVRHTPRRMTAQMGVAVSTALLAAVACNWPINPESQLNAMAYSNVGTILARNGDLDGALTLFQRAVEGNPQSAEAHYNVGVTWAIKGDHEQAVTELETAHRLNPDTVQIDYQLAVSLERTGQVDRAIEHFGRALQIDPTDNDARQALQRLARRPK